MLRDAIDAFIRRIRSPPSAWRSQDDEVDRLYDQVYRELLTYMVNDPRTIDRATWLLWVAHNLERIADRVRTSASARCMKSPGRCASCTTPKWSKSEPPEAGALRLHAQLRAVPDGRGLPSQACRQCRGSGGGGSGRVTD